MGIDIFSGDGDAGINISKLEAQFVIVKTTQGTSYLNPYWKKHADAVLKAGKLLGFYHYASTNCGGGSAKEQADYFVKTIGKKYIGKAVLCLDWEQNNGDNSNFGKGKTSVKWCKTFLDRVYKKTGVKPLIYMSRSVATGDNWKSVSDAGYGLWMAQYLYKYYNGSDTPHVSYQSNPTLRKGSYGSWSSPTIYQYTSEGKDKGYSGCLDFNTFYGSSKDWKKLAAQVK
jgi:GH25 family lysozyme M1 (1,4-beta-N-acetylmuramidase)